jgi:hypothetical protein
VQACQSFWVIRATLKNCQNIKWYSGQSRIGAHFKRRWAHFYNSVVFCNKNTRKSTKNSVKEKSRAALNVGLSCGPWATQSHGSGSEFEMFWCVILSSILSFLTPLLYLCSLPSHMTIFWRLLSQLQTYGSLKSNWVNDGLLKAEPQLLKCTDPIMLVLIGDYVPVCVCLRRNVKIPGSVRDQYGYT